MLIQRFTWRSNKHLLAADFDVNVDCATLYCAKSVCEGIPASIIIYLGEEDDDDNEKDEEMLRTKQKKYHIEAKEKLFELSFLICIL